MPDPSAADPAAILDEMRAVLRKAAPGPWGLVEDDYNDPPDEQPCGLRLPVPQCKAPKPHDFECLSFDELPPGTIEFIAASREQVPRLLAALGVALEHIRSGDDSAEDGIAAITRELTGKDGS
ncbi:MAG: hypothetical protein M3Y33_08595 [Actinomycetota bacterium]|nr:hypothetical protein [Actinomycetota bacterium]